MASAQLEVPQIVAALAFALEHVVDVFGLLRVF
jgi:hypothetical protein